jgi:hypothetical protein
VSDVAGLALAVTAVALWIAAVADRAPRRWRLAELRWWPASARPLGAVATVVAACAFSGAHGEVSGALVAAATVTGVASLAIVALPVLPRATWSILAAAPAVAVVAAVLGGLGG